MKSLSNFLDEAKATYCGRCEATHVPPSKGGTCPAVKEEVNPAHYDIAGLIKKAKAKNDPKHPAMKHVAAIEDIKKNGGALSVQGDHVRSLIKALGEEAQIEEGEEKGGGYDGMPKGLQDRSPRGSSRGAMGRAIARKERNLARARMDRAAEMKKEEVELDEVSAAKLRDYSDAASDARGHRNLPTAKLDKRYKSMALAHEKIRARHAKVAATEETAKTLSQFFEEANSNLFEADQIKAHHERVKKLKGKKVSFTHPVSKQKITGTMQKIVQMGGLPYAHVETGKSAHRVPVHQID